MFEQVFKNIDDILHKDAGCSSELDYVEQTSWLLFLKYLEDLEKDKKTAAELAGKKYSNIIGSDFRWETWAAPKGKDGKIDHHKALTGDDLKDFVDHKLFPYLKKFKTEAESPDTIEYKIGEIFSELKNKIQSGYNMREVINLVDGLRFRSHTEKHEMSALYEDKIQNMGNAGRNGGEYYTPRPLIKTIVKVVAPAIGDKVYDGAVGSAGFLCEAFEYLKTSKNLTTKDAETLQKRTFYGKEKKGLAYIIGTMNMILHGVEAPNIVHTNTLAENLADIQEKDRYDVVLANPPFGGKERAEVQQNFPIKTGETASLFLQHFIKLLKAGGKAGVVIKNTFLSNTDSASISLRKLLLENCNLHTVLELPRGVFMAGGQTVVLFFEKGTRTRKIWHYQLNLGRNLGKKSPLIEKDFEEFCLFQKTKQSSINSWVTDVANISLETFDLSGGNPNAPKPTPIRAPAAILEGMEKIDHKTKQALTRICGFKDLLDSPEVKWKTKTLGELCNIEIGRTPARKNKKFWDVEKRTKNVWLSIADLLNAKDNIIYDSKEYISDIAAKTSRVVPKGTLLVSFKLTLGRLAFAGSDLFTNEAIAALEVKNEKEISKDFLFYYLSFFDWHGATKGDVKIKGKTLNKKKLKDIIVRYPESLPQQKDISEKLKLFANEIESIEALYQSKLTDLVELEKSILKAVFDKRS